MADETTHVDGAAAAPTHAEVQQEAKGGLPQFNIETFPSQIAWLALTFIILYVVMSRSALPKVAKVLEAREGRIRSDLEAADKARNEADALKVSLEAKLAQARAQAKASVDAKRAEVQADIAAKQVAVDADLAAKADEAARNIAAAKAAAMSNLEAISVDVTSALLSKVGVAADEAAIAAAVKAGMPKGV